MPILGQGTWRMAENSSKRASEIAALRLGLDLGMTLIDTAEMYANGGAEELVGEALGTRRDEAYLVSKVYPHNASARGVPAACERSLKRLKTDALDLYLLHWRGSIPLAETLDAFVALKKAGKIRAYGVSNFDVDDMEEALALPGGDQIVTNQVLYNLANRGIEFDLIPWCRKRGISIMAYTPFDDPSELFRSPALKAVAARHNATPALIALAWIMRQEGVVVIPKSGDTTHVKENHGALKVKLTPADLKTFDEAFPPPQKKVSLAMR